MNQRLTDLSAQAALFLTLMVIGINSATSAVYRVTTPAEYESAAVRLEPGDRIELADGVWQDFEILFEARGTAQNPIQLTAQTKGKVVISGQSNLRLAGEYLLVSGLIFRDGYTPSSEVIAFRKDKESVASHSRVTEVVIDNFNNPERTENDSWVTVYGRNNRFDHNQLIGKRNKGVTMAVRLNTEASQQNRHLIDHNYFGPRPILGSNGGETLRIGTSHYSLTDSFTKVENNYFDRCDGELEIISNKSGRNEFRGNVFFESRGTLTMRHGNDNLIEDNVFFGNNVDHTGGIRVINKRQTIRNNYLEGLAGYRFGGALVVMNGVPNSVINRYHQVEDSVIENNSLVESAHVQLAAGSDAERTAVPINTNFVNNLIYTADKRDVFTVYDDISGIKFAGNRINDVTSPVIETGFTNKPMTMQRASNGLMYPLNEEVGVSRDLKPISKNETGVSWYPKPDKRPTFGFGKTVRVEPGLDTLSSAVKVADDGDVLELRPGLYTQSRTININKAVTISAAQIANEPTVSIVSERSALIELRPGGSIEFNGVRISGAESPDSSGNSVIRTVRRSMLTNYEVVVNNSVVSNLDINHSFSFLDVAKGTFADRIEIHNSRFEDITGSILKLKREDDDYGIYNAEYVTITESQFNNIGGALVDYYRGGTDESTFGPHFVLKNSALSNVGNDKRNKSKSVLRLHGVQVSRVEGNTFSATAPISILHTVGEPVTEITQNKFIDVSPISVIELNSDQTNTALIDRNQYEETSK